MREEEEKMNFVTLHVPWKSSTVYNILFNIDTLKKTCHKLKLRNESCL